MSDATESRLTDASRTAEWTAEATPTAHRTSTSSERRRRAADAPRGSLTRSRSTSRRGAASSCRGTGGPAVEPRRAAARRSRRSCSSSSRRRAWPRWRRRWSRPTDAVQDAIDALRAVLRRAQRRHRAARDRRRGADLHPQRARRRRRAVPARRPAQPADPGRARDPGRDRLPPAGHPGAGVGDPWRQRRRRRAHPARPRPGRRGRARDPETGGGLFRTTELFLEKMGLRSLDELPSLAPLLPDIDGLDDVDREPTNCDRDLRRVMTTMTAADDGIRLQKVLAAAGVGLAPQVRGADRRGPGDRRRARSASWAPACDPETAVIHVDGDRVIVRDDWCYLALNKPRGVLSAMCDDRGRPTVGDLVARPSRAAVPRRPAGRRQRGPAAADERRRPRAPADAPVVRGAQDLPGHRARARCRKDVGRRLLAGVELDDGPAKADEFRVVQTEGERAIVEVVLHEGRKHIVRRMLAEVGHPVERLVRTRIGPVHLGGQRPGTLRPLTRQELAELHRTAETGARPRGAEASRRPGGHRSHGSTGGARARSRSSRRPGRDPGRHVRAGDRGAAAQRDRPGRPHQHRVHRDARPHAPSSRPTPRACSG